MAWVYAADSTRSRTSRVVKLLAGVRKEYGGIVLQECRLKYQLAVMNWQHMRPFPLPSASSMATSEQSCHARLPRTHLILADSFDPRGLRSDMHPWVNVHRVTPWPAQDGQRIPVGYSHIL